MAVTSMHIYIADSACACIHVLVDGQEQEPIAALADSIAANDEILYITDTNEFDEVIVRRISQDGSETAILFEDAGFDAPLLALDRANNLIALIDGSSVYRLVSVDGEPSFRYQYDLDIGIIATAIGFNSSNNLIVASEGDGIFTFDSDGTTIGRIGQVVTDILQAGEIAAPNSIAGGADGTIYWVESDGQVGHINAASLNVDVGRVGATTLVTDVPVQGLLDAQNLQQVWLLDVPSNTTVSLTALADFASDLDIAIRILAPDGREVAAVDNDESGELFNYFDVAIRNLRLQQGGQYVVIVERMSGDGRYTLGMTMQRLLSIEDNHVEVTSTLQASIPQQQWQVDLRGGQTVTITMQAINEELDTILYLYDPNGNLIAENDDADDITLGFNSQLVDMRIPFAGTYIIEANRFNGEGDYRLTIDVQQ